MSFARSLGRVDLQQRACPARIANSQSLPKQTEDNIFRVHSHQDKLTDCSKCRDGSCEPPHTPVIGRKSYCFG